MKDIIRVEPDLFDIAMAHNTMEIREESEKKKRIESPKDFKVGICEECGNTELLYNVDGALICESCRERM